MQNPTAPASDSTASDVGTLLCATRMRMGKDLQRVAEILHIRYNYLVAMEDGRYEDLPGQAYAIGFVRAYADHLGLNGDEIVRRYKDESAGLKNRPVFEFPLPTPDSGLPSGALILVAIVLGMVVYGLWFAIAGSDRAVVELIQPVPDRLAVSVSAPPPQAAADLPADMPPATEDDAKGSSVADSEIASTGAAPATVAVVTPIPASSTPAAVSPPSAAPVLSAPPASTDVVELRAKSDVWITLRTSDNPDRTQLLHKGEVFRAPEGGGGMTLVTGKPTDLEILLNGQIMPPLDAGVFARGVPLDPSRLKSGAALTQAAGPAPGPGVGTPPAAPPGAAPNAASRAAPGESPAQTSSAPPGGSPPPAPNANSPAKPGS